MLYVANRCKNENWFANESDEESTINLNDSINSRSRPLPRFFSLFRVTQSSCADLNLNEIEARN